MVFNKHQVLRIRGDGRDKMTSYNDAAALAGLAAKTFQASQGEIPWVSSQTMTMRKSNRNKQAMVMMKNDEKMI